MTERSGGKSDHAARIGSGQRAVRPIVLLLFPDEWLAFSPMTINLMGELDGRFDANVVAIDTGKYGRLNDPRITYLRINLYFARALAALGLYKFVKAFLLRRYLRWNRPDIVVAVDSVGAYAAQGAGVEFHYLSLEVCRDWFFSRIKREKILSVLIQTSERYAYLFGESKLPTYLVQNAPSFHRRWTGVRDENALVYFGNAIAKHAIFQCVEFIDVTDKWSLTVKGNIPPAVRVQLQRRYSSLLQDRRLVLDDNYMPDEGIQAYLGRFHAGFCLYDLSLIDAGDFNYMSVPSGKLFSYYAAGVPVIASDMPGLSSVSRYQTGVALSSLSAGDIGQALETIDSDYSNFVDSCFRSAERFSFTRNIQPFIASLDVKQASSIR